MYLIANNGTSQHGLIQIPLLKLKPGIDPHLNDVYSQFKENKHEISLVISSLAIVFRFVQ